MTMFLLAILLVHFRLCVCVASSGFGVGIHVEDSTSESGRDTPELPAVTLRRPLASVTISSDGGRKKRFSAPIVRRQHSQVFHSLVEPTFTETRAQVSQEKHVIQKDTKSTVDARGPIPSSSRCVYINLEERTDRKSKIESLLSRTGISCDRVAATHTRATSLAGLAVNVTARSVAAVGRVAGADACRRSHLKALTRIHDSGIPWGAVLEDDATWDEPRMKLVWQNVSAALKEHPVVLLSCNFKGLSRGPHKNELPSTQFDWLSGAEDCQTTSAYAIRRDYIPVLQNLWEATGFIDMTWKQLQRPDNWAVVVPTVVIQSPSFSNIEGRDVNYGTLLDHGER